MMRLTYLSVLLLSFAGIATLDHRHHLAFFKDKASTAIAVVTGVIVFTLWDGAGIALGIFFAGSSPYVTGIMLAPDYPLEEVVFLLFLCYFTLVMYRLVEEKWLRT